MKIIFGLIILIVIAVLEIAAETRLSEHEYNGKKAITLFWLARAITVAATVATINFVAPPIARAGGGWLILASILTMVMLAVFVEHTWRWFQNGSYITELIIFIVLAILMLFPALAIASAWSVVTTSAFWKSVIMALPLIAFVSSTFAMLFDFFFFRYTLKEDETFKVLAILVAVVFVTAIILILTTGLKWGSLRNNKVKVAETTKPVTIEAKAEEKTSPTPEVVATEEKELEYKTMKNGVVYNYDEYLDRDHKEAYNAFGYDKSEFHGDEKAMKREFIKMADLAPEYLAAYAEGFFFDEEKKQLGIYGKTAVQIDDYMSVEQNTDAGKLQEDLLTALAAKVNSDEVEFRFVKENGWEYTYYIYETGQTPDELTPFGARLSVDHKKRTNAPQVEVYRKVYSDKGGGKDGKFTWVKVLDLNEECGLQVNVQKVPSGTPVIPPDKPPVNPPPTPPTPPTPPKYNKDKTQGTKGEVVQQNDTPKAGEPTNNPANPKSSTKEEPGNTGNGKTTYKEYQEEIKELKEDNSENPKAPKEIETPTPVSDLAEKADGKIPNNEKNPETKHIAVPD